MENLVKGETLSSKTIKPVSLKVKVEKINLVDGTRFVATTKCWLFMLLLYIMEKFTRNYY